MADISVRSSNKNAVTSDTAIGVTAPTGTTTGDVVVAVVACNNVITLSDDNGATPFTKDYEGSDGGTGWTFAIFSRRIQAGDPSSYGFTQNGAATRMGVIAVTFQDPNPSTIYDVAPSSSTANIIATSTSNTVVNPTTTIDKSIVCAACEWDGAGNTITPPSDGEGGFTEQQNESTEQVLSFITKTRTPAGTPNIGTFTAANTQGNITVSFAVANSSAAASVPPMFRGS